MSRHEGVSCDECLKGNFRGRRFKCLRCYDYDLCSSCYEGGASTARHPLEHPMQCILTRVDYDLYYGGDSGSGEQPQAFTCPYCGHMGFTESALQEHVSSQHAETSTEVICPVCAALPGGDPNHVTDDFTAHLTLEHRAPRDLDESSSVRHVRRMFHPGRGLGGPRARRTNMHFTSGSAGGLTSSSTSSSSSQSSSYTPSNREAMDPIAELLSQLSGVRRAAGGAGGAHPGGPSASQLQTQLTLQGAPRTPPETAARQAARRGNHTHTHHHHHPQNPSQHQHPPPPGTTALSSPAHAAAAAQDHAPNCHGSSPFLLARLGASRPNEAEWQRAERSLFVQELLLSTLMHASSSSSSSSSSSCASAAAVGGRRDFAAFGAGACVDALPLGVALERLELSSASLGVEPRPPPL